MSTQRGGVCIYPERDRPLLIKGRGARPILRVFTWYLLYVVGSRAGLSHSEEERAIKSPG